MKNLLFIALIGLLLVSCESNDTTTNAKELTSISSNITPTVLDAKYFRSDYPVLPYFIIKIDSIDTSIAEIRVLSSRYDTGEVLQLIRYYDEDHNFQDNQIYTYTFDSGWFNMSLCSRSCYIDVIAINRDGDRGKEFTFIY